LLEKMVVIFSKLGIPQAFAVCYYWMVIYPIKMKVLLGYKAQPKKYKHLVENIKGIKYNNIIIKR
jgi:hypothetical protein